MVHTNVSLDHPTIFHSNPPTYAPVIYDSCHWETDLSPPTPRKLDIDIYIQYIHTLSSITLSCIYLLHMASHNKNRKKKDDVSKVRARMPS